MLDFAPPTCYDSSMIERINELKSLIQFYNSQIINVKQALDKLEESKREVLDELEEIKTQLREDMMYEEVS
jgi:peptidoglycan hydrolase CwlO-like protein